jgi:hypothetical protein
VTGAEFLLCAIAIHIGFSIAGYEGRREQRMGRCDRAFSGWGIGIMRDRIERDVPDTEPYQELLAVMGAIIVVAVGLTVLLSQGVLS